VAEQLPPDREALIQGYLDGTLDSEGCQRLLAMMKDDPSLAREVTADLRLDEMLKKNFRDQHVAEPDALPAVAVAESTSEKQRPSSRRIRRLSAPRLRARRTAFSPWTMALLAASLALVVGAYLYFAQSKTSVPTMDVAQQTMPKSDERDTSTQQIPPIAPKPEPATGAPREIARIAALPQGSHETAALVRTENERVARLPLEENLPICLGDRLETGAAVQVNIRYEAEETALEVGPETAATFGEEDGAKRIALDRGSLQAEVAPQPQGRPLVFTTPQATTEVLGTRLALSSRDDASCLAVTYGKVMMGGKQEQKKVLVSTGEYAVAGTYEPLESHLLAPVPGSCRVIEDNESGMRWTGVPWSDPVNASLSNAHAVSGTSAVRLEYRHRPQDEGGRGYGMISRPLTLAAEDRFLSTRVYVERTEAPAILNVLFMLKDGGGWFMRDVRLTRRPAGTWFTFVAPVQTPKKKNNEVGGDRFDPLEVVSVQLSIFGGSATVYLDDLGLSAADPMKSPGGKP
jgi:hypothetical protein